MSKNCSRLFKDVLSLNSDELKHPHHRIRYSVLDDLHSEPHYVPVPVTLRTVYLELFTVIQPHRWCWHFDVLKHPHTGSGITCGQCTFRTTPMAAFFNIFVVTTTDDLYRTQLQYRRTQKYLEVVAGDVGIRSRSTGDRLLLW